MYDISSSVESVLVFTALKLRGNGGNINMTSITDCFYQIWDRTDQNLYFLENQLLSLRGLVRLPGILWAEMVNFSGSSNRSESRTVL